MPARIGSLVQRFYDQLWNRWDDSAVDQVLAPGFSFRGSLGRETSGREGWRRYRDQVRQGAPDFHNEVVDMVVQRTRAAARLRYTGMHTGPLLGISATSRAFSYEGAAFFTAEAGFLQSAWVLGDLDGLSVS
ncbi:hypothetical protein BH24ACT13_BH24ACT13_03240 [soil metagenome]